MKQTFEVINVKCGGCAGTLKKSLAEEFGEVEVNLEVTPRKITLDVDDSQMETLRSKLKSLGYPMADEDLNTLEKIGTTAKSFASCAVGKMAS
uniref:Copper chaperone n=1 Tax=uncultured Thiotrichaceae bacterium TaxID=298394 RepID=A0A6S6UAL3_9GAMM|nr:MAG: Copper chaperone [uncultured Thiotrichaceae bacterium]